MYSQADVDSLRNHIMFPAAKPTILNTIARGAMGQSVKNQGVSLINIFDEETTDKIAQSAWGRFWTIFSDFGSTSAELLGIYIIIYKRKKINC